MRHLVFLVGAMFACESNARAATVHIGALNTGPSSPSGASSINQTKLIAVDLSSPVGLVPGQDIKIEFTPDAALIWTFGLSYNVGTVELLARAEIQISAGANSLSYAEARTFGPFPVTDPEPGPPGGPVGYVTFTDPTSHSFVVPWGTDLSAVSLRLSDKSSIVASGGLLYNASMYLNGATFTTSSVVPEPSVLVLAALLPITWLRRKRR